MKLIEVLTKHNKALEVEKIIEIVKPNPILRINQLNLNPKKYDFWDLKWNDLILLRQYVKENDIINLMNLMYSINQSKFYELEVYNCFAVYKWIVDQLNQLNNVWYENLNVEPTQKQKDAGIDNFNDFGEYSTLEVLTKGDSTKEDYYLNKTASYIFRKLCYNKVKNDFDENYIELSKKK